MVLSYCVFHNTQSHKHIATASLCNTLAISHSVRSARIRYSHDQAESDLRHARARLFIAGAVRAVVVAGRIAATA